ncbi:hypothetical protein [Thermoflexibacter ruber]|uniref:Uncharacterized protein n=1 Tax=Thermoflexibacter ruber TaxID=1003 RepID=A0A1I2I574_9BACT|nr:hypothetical protein [Thermoflexibacter ruber]SFF37432.1 hypothetical protein SAMN04488541_10292 [Thermoflexibacter ruber]
MRKIKTKKIISIIKLLIFSLLYLLCISCESNSPDKVVRHEKIPKEAKWYGGSDGGDWIYVRKKIAKNTFLIEVYNDYTGELIVTGNFTICKYCDFVDLQVKDLLTLIAFYDGEEILLSSYFGDKSCFLEKR